MPPAPIMTENTLFYGDNLDILREYIASNSVDREGAAIGVFITLEDPSRDMNTEAVSAGFYSPPGWGQKYPKVQILTISDLLRGCHNV